MVGNIIPRLMKWLASARAALPRYSQGCNRIGITRTVLPVQSSANNIQRVGAIAD
jgi:hypothetical protein